MEPVRYRALLAYDGANYLGFQRLAGDQPTIQAERRVPDRVDTPVQAMETPRMQPVLDRLPPKPQLEQLPHGDDTVLQ